MSITAYYGSRISDSISKTPEGFLVCRDVPIARVGVQEYLGREIGQDERPDDVFKVNRPANEVFNKAAIASFEGKPICDNHPAEDVTADNYAQYIRGVVRDVKKGTGRYDGCLVADLVIHDSTLVRAVQDGKREISCGYNCLWVPTGDHTLEQREIRGNHVAVVDRGRAGHGVAIHDSAMERRMDMSKNKNLIQRMWAAFAKDAEPEEALEAAKLVNGECKDEDPAPAPAAEKEDPTEARFKRIEDALESVNSQLAALNKPAPQAQEEGGEEKDALDALESELKETKTCDEEEVIADPAQINAKESVADEGLIEAGEEDGEEVKKAALDTIDALRPVVAAIPDKARRRRASDALAGLIRGQVRDSGYLAIQRAAKAGAKDHKMDDADLGRNIAKKYNPHYVEK